MNKPEDFPKGELVCQRCGEPKAAKQRQNTAYENDESNWVTLCPDCAAENADYWDEQWAEYYSDCM